MEGGGSEALSLEPLQNTFASKAYQLRANLNVEPARTSLYKMAHLEWFLSETPLDLGSGQCAERMNRLQAIVAGLAVYHEALPFSEAERRWVSNTCATVNSDREYQWRAAKASVAMEIVNARRAEIMTAGVRRAIVGSELLRKWVSWRRQTDEFEGQDSFRTACLGLWIIVGAFASEKVPPALSGSIQALQP
jgi:hypothetical protein